MAVKRDAQREKKLPVLMSKRLILKPFTFEEAHDVQHLAGHREVAATTLNIPHPYEDGMADQWIRRHEKEFCEGTSLTLAIFTKEPEQLVGAIGMAIDRKNDRGTLGYWIGREFWNRGYCTEATRVIVEYSFQILDLHRIYAMHFAGNKSSGRVMEKMGMKREGLLREHVKKWGEYHHLVLYGLMKEEFFGQLEEERE